MSHYPPAYVPEPKAARKMTLTARQLDKARADWEAAIERALIRPGSWLEHLAHNAARATNRTPEQVAKAWGHNPTWATS